LGVALAMAVLVVVVTSLAGSAPARAVSFAFAAVGVAVIFSAISTLAYWPSLDRSDVGLVDVPKARRRDVRRAVFSERAITLSAGETRAAARLASGWLYVAPYELVRMLLILVGVSSIAVQFLVGGFASGFIVWVSWYCLLISALGLAIALPRRARLVRRATRFEKEQPKADRTAPEAE